MSVRDIMIEQQRAMLEKEAPKLYYKELTKKAKAIVSTMELLEDIPEPDKEYPYYRNSVKCAFENLLGETYSAEEAKEMCNVVRQILNNRLENLQTDFEAFKQQNEQK